MYSDDILGNIFKTGEDCYEVVPVEKEYFIQPGNGPARDTPVISSGLLRLVVITAPVGTAMWYGIIKFAMWLVS